MHWSGGKDATLSLYKLIQTKEYDISCLLTTLSESYRRVSMHGVRESLLDRQAKELGLPLQKLFLPESTSMKTYSQLMETTLEAFCKKGVKHAAFGDIFLEDLKKYRDQQLSKVAMKGTYPLWKSSTTAIVHEFIDLGFKAVVACVDATHLDQSFAGRFIDADFLKDLPKNVDPCGENGEFHSIVFDGPLFQNPVSFQKGDIVYKTYPLKTKQKNTSDCSCTDELEKGFWFCDLIPN